MIVADSDVLIDALRGHPGASERVTLELKAGSLATTSVTAFELHSGCKPADKKKLEALLDALTILPLDAEAAAAAAQVRRDLESAGQKIGMADYLIAGICIARSAVLLTNNRRHFERVPGLRLGDRID